MDNISDSQHFSLRWNNYLNHITDAFGSLRSAEDFVDVTLSCEGKKIHAHKMLLSVWSPYFKDIFKENPCKHPVIIFRNVKHDDLVTIVDFMYQGEVNVEQGQLPSFLATAELLQIKGLTSESTCENNQNDNSSQDIYIAPPTSKSNDSESLSNTECFSSGTKLPLSPKTRKRKCNFILTSDKKLSKLITTESSNDNKVEYDEPVINIVQNIKSENEIIIDTSYDEFIDESETKLNFQSGLITSEPNIKSSASKYDSVSNSLKGNTSNVAVVKDEILMESGISTLIHQDSDSNGFGQTKQTVDGTKYVCNECGATYAHDKHLKSHMAVHNGETVCFLCLKVLSRKSHLLRHLRHIHGYYLDKKPSNQSSS
uniref:BTB domain-containing protein n=1 Tax=Clastoptera arizonana TaxID=38151 RepID=A0A1B6D176_9HEMI